ncbi:MAG: glycolate oxidase subunit GlcF [Armatimonadota bacterium]|nr:glycolate oxidase subunit GlcF [Armatimonadota bacterium]MDR5696143.1 glycolate oxidase subunit GlcF [Armatimonadota bacterium]
MQHKIPLGRYGAAGAHMAQAVETCVHCGFCLPACPTYRVLGEEMDSPRGRIFLMKEVLEGSLAPDEAAPFVDRCLGCMACVTACPSGVRYGELLVPFRDHAEQHRRRPIGERVLRRVVMATLPHPGRFRLAAWAGRLAGPLAHILPSRLQAMVELLPSSLPSALPLPEVVPAQGTRRARVALLSGCVQEVLAPEINRATLRVLSRNGIETVISKEQGCCGALPMHAGEAKLARALARRNLAAFPPDVDAVVTNAAGCGSAMREYGLLFAGHPEAPTAEALARRVRDVSDFLAEVGIVPSGSLGAGVRVAYHDPCHLAHAQGVREAPRRLLSTVANLSLLEPEEWEICCGSAGIYNLEQPDIAQDLGRRKAHNLLATGAEVVATGNVGCIVQIRAHLARLGRSLPVLHTMEILDRAYSGLPLA